VRAKLVGLSYSVEPRTQTIKGDALKQFLRRVLPKGDPTLYWAWILFHRWFLREKRAALRQGFAFGENARDVSSSYFQSWPSAPVTACAKYFCSRIESCRPADVSCAEPFEEKW
jgi:hypothetical protein